MITLPEELKLDGMVEVGTIDVSEYVSSSGQLVKVGKRPSASHQFNHSSMQWEDPRTPETEWPVVRAQRDRLLLACDWTQLPDVPLATQTAWASYRQALRDITLQADPFNLVWPVTP